MASLSSRSGDRARPARLPSRKTRLAAGRLSTRPAVLFGLGRSVDEAPPGSQARAMDIIMSVFEDGQPGLGSIQTSPRLYHPVRVQFRDRKLILHGSPEP